MRKAVSSFALMVLAVSISAQAANLYAPSPGGENSVDWVVLNNSGHTLTPSQISNSPGSSCLLPLGSEPIPSGGYFVLRGQYTSHQGGSGITCNVNLLADNNMTVTVSLFDPVYAYAGAPFYQAYVGGTLVSSNYLPSLYPESPLGLMDANVTLIINSF